MDFAQLDLKTASEAGSWVQLEHDGAPMFADDKDKKPCRLQLRGMASVAVANAARKIERINLLQSQKLARTPDKDADGVARKFQSEMEEAGNELILAGVQAWENINWNGEPLPLEPENVLKICGSGTLFFAQVRNALLENKRLFTNAGAA